MRSCKRLAMWMACAALMTAALPGTAYAASKTGSGTRTQTESTRTRPEHSASKEEKDGKGKSGQDHEQDMFSRMVEDGTISKDTCEKIQNWIKEHADDSTLKKPEIKSEDSSSKKSDSKSGEKPPTKPEEKSGDKSSEKTDGKSGEKPPAKPQGKSSDQETGSSSSGQTPPAKPDHKSSGDSEKQDSRVDDMTKNLLDQLLGADVITQEQYDAIEKAIPSITKERKAAAGSVL